MNILLAMGTRPEIIKLGPVYRELRDRGLEADVYWSNQHPDMGPAQLSLFDIQPCWNSTNLGKSLTNSCGNILVTCGEILQKKRYDWVIVQGDTTTAMACAHAAFLSGVKVAHVEAGLRTDDIHSPFPEEANRRIISVVANHHFAPTKTAADRLLSEGATNVIVSGNTVIDALLFARKKVFAQPETLREKWRTVEGKKLVLVTLHRRENLGHPLQNILEGIKSLAQDKEIHFILPVHKNPLVASQVRTSLAGIDNIQLVEPLDYLDFVYLLNKAWTVITDSGGIQEEAPTFGLRVIITRDNTERPEVVESGFGVLVGSDPTALKKEVMDVIKGHHRHLIDKPNPFGDGHASKYIVDTLTQEA